jgi:hypothetical protein
MQRLSAALHGTLGSHLLRDALQEGSADAVACLSVPRAWVFFSLSLFLLGGLRCFLLKKSCFVTIMKYRPWQQYNDSFIPLRRVDRFMCKDCAMLLRVPDAVITINHHHSLS